ncbi:MAG: hypothetical protein ACLR5H_00285 [Oscillospiraceae bacterium]
MGRQTLQVARSWAFPWRP